MAQLVENHRVQVIVPIRGRARRCGHWAIAGRLREPVSSSSLGSIYQPRPAASVDKMMSPPAGSRSVFHAVTSVSPNTPCGRLSATTFTGNGKGPPKSDATSEPRSCDRRQPQIKRLEHLIARKRSCSASRAAPSRARTRHGLARSNPPSPSAWCRATIQTASSRSRKLSRPPGGSCRHRNRSVPEIETVAVNQIDLVYEVPGLNQSRDERQSQNLGEVGCSRCRGSNQVFLPTELRRRSQSSARLPRRLQFPR